MVLQNVICIMDKRKNKVRFYPELLTTIIHVYLKDLSLRPYNNTKLYNDQYKY